MFVLFLYKKIIDENYFARLFSATQKFIFKQMKDMTNWSCIHLLHLHRGSNIFYIKKLSLDSSGFVDIAVIVSNR